MKFKLKDRVISIGGIPMEGVGVVIKVDSGIAPYFVRFPKQDYWKVERNLKLADGAETKVVKPTNPKDAVGVKKAPLWYIPSGPLFEVGLAFMEGARKYGAWNWRQDGVRVSVYIDALDRHIKAYKEGEDIDPDSGIHHLMKAAACLFVLRDSMLMGNCTDDRPIRYPEGLDLKGFNEQAAELIEKYPECAKPFLEKDKDEGDKSE